METIKIIKSHNHSHYWIEDEKLFESYKTIRGLRYRFIRELKGYIDSDRVTDETISEIEGTDIHCTLFVGVLNSPTYKCDDCGKYEWQHKL